MKALIFWFYCLSLFCTNGTKRTNTDGYELCDTYFTKCEADCGSGKDSNIKSCELCCDLVDAKCISHVDEIKGDLMSPSIAEYFSLKYDLCIEDHHSKYDESNRFMKTERMSTADYPQIKQTFAFENGSYSLSHNVRILDPLDYIDCSHIVFKNESHFLDETSYIYLDYNSVTKLVKMGSILVMHKEAFLNGNTLSDECRLIPGVKVTDLELIQDQSLLKINVITPNWVEYFDSMDVKIDNGDLYALNHTLVQSKQKPSENMDAPSADYTKFNYTSVVKKYECYLVIDHHYAVKKLDKSICNYYKPLLQALKEAKYDGYGSTNNEDSNTSVRRRMWDPLNEIKRIGKSTVEWVDTTANAGLNAADSSFDYVNDLSGDVYEVVTETGAAIGDLAVAFGEAVFAGIMDLIAWFDNFFESGITYTIPIGIWLDPADATEFTLVATAVEVSQELPGDMTITFTAGGTIAVETLTMCKLGGAIIFEAAFSLVPIEFNYMKFALAAGIGFETDTTFTMSAEADINLEMVYTERPFLFFVSVLPIQVTLFAGVSLGVGFQSGEYVFQFHTGLGEISYEFGFEMGTNGKLTQYKSSTFNPQRPYLDAAFYVNGGNCFEVEITPYLTFQAGLIFYHAIESFFEVTFALPLLLEYPETCNANDKCSSSQNYVKLSPNSANGDLDVTFNFVTQLTDDIDNVLLLMGLSSDVVDGLELVIPIFATTLAGFDFALCLPFNLKALIDLCCPITAPDDSPMVAEPQHTVAITDGIDLHSNTVVGMDYPIQYQVFQIISASNDQYLCSWTDLLGDLGLTFVSKNSADNDKCYWYFEYIEGQLHKYKIRNVGDDAVLYEKKYNIQNFPAIYLIKLSTSNNPGDSSGQRQWILTVREYIVYNKITSESDTFPIFTIQLQSPGDGSSEPFLSAPTPSILKSDANNVDNHWILYLVDDYVMPIPYMEYYIRLPNYAGSDTYLSASSDSETMFLKNEDKGTGRQRWMIEPIGFMQFRLLLQRGVTGNHYFLKVKGNNNDGTVDMGKDGQDADDRDYWSLHKQATDSFYIKSESTLSQYSGGDYYLQAKGNSDDTVRIESNLNSNNRALWKFELVDLYIDYPVNGDSQKYYIQQYDTSYRYVYSDQYQGSDAYLSIKSSENPSWKRYMWSFHLCDCNELQTENLYFIRNRGTLQNGNYRWLTTESDGSALQLSNTNDDKRARFKFKRIGYTDDDDPIFNILVEDVFSDGVVRFLHGRSGECTSSQCGLYMKDPAVTDNLDLQKWVIRKVPDSAAKQEVAVVDDDGDVDDDDDGGLDVEIKSVDNKDNNLGGTRVVINVDVYVVVFVFMFMVSFIGVMLTIWMKVIRRVKEGELVQCHSDTD